MILEKIVFCKETKTCKICGTKGVKRVVKNIKNGAVMTLIAKRK